jgi:transcriptional regulator with XRE-family HTH domain
MADDQSNPALIQSPGQRFGRRLREQREHLGITLDAIAASTKIKSSLLAGLERGDVSGWPAGIFQRAFIREYARAIGLVPEPIVAEFAQVFAAAAAEKPCDIPPSSGGELRLTLAVEPTRFPSVFTPALVGAVEAAGIVLIAAAASWIAATGFAATCCALMLLYYPIATAYVGCTPAAWFLKRDVAFRDRRRAPDVSIPAADRRDRFYLVKSAAEPQQPDGKTGKTEKADADSDSVLRRSAMR